MLTGCHFDNGKLVWKVLFVRKIDLKQNSIVQRYKTGKFC